MAAFKPVLNVGELEFQARPPAFAAKGAAAERFDAKMAQVGSRIGMRKLGCNVTAVPPGKRAFPFHSHQANEEMFFVLQGRGEVRIGGETYEIREGDVIACPSGGPETAHQIVNTGDVELRYLAISTKLAPEIAEYPDSGKFGVLGEPGANGAPGFRFVGRAGQGLDYWEGE